MNLKIKKDKRVENSLLRLIGVNPICRVEKRKMPRFKIKKGGLKFDL